MYVDHRSLLSDDLMLTVQYANVMGLQQDLKMKGQQFSWLATGFFIAYAVAELPQGTCLTD